MVTTEDFLRFWAKAIPSLQIHPDDAVALKANWHTLALDAPLVHSWGRFAPRPLSC